MSGKFVRASKYRHVFGQPAKKELQYENIKVTNNAWDSNIIKSNGKFISVTWNASGGGAFAVIPVEEVGKCPDQVPLFRGHSAQVLDTDFDPFNDHRLASGSDDSKIGIWEIPENYSFHNYLDENGEVLDIEPIKKLSGHTRKVGHVLFHPVAQNVLASSSLDYTVKLWNVETGENLITLKHPDMVTSMSFSYDGNHLATVARDRKLRVWDIRKEEVISEGQAHAGAKNQRVVWLGNSDRLATTGFSKLSDRQIGIWDAFNLEKGDLGGFYTVDQSSGILMPFYDDGNKILYLAGKGDGNIRYYEFQNDELFELSEYQSTDPQRGFAVAPKRMVNVRENEVLRCFKTVVDHCIEPLSFYVPRRSEEFQDDIYPDAPSGKPALTAEEWFSGKSVEGPILISMRNVYDGSELTFHASKKAIKKESSVKSPSPSPSPAAEQAKKDIKKNEPTEAESPAPVSKSVSPRPPPVKETFRHDESVDRLLQRATEFDKANDAEDPSRDTSGWDEEDEKPAPVDLPAARNEIPTKERSEPPAKPSQTAEEKPAPVEPVSQATPASSKPEDAPKPDTTQLNGAAKSLGLKQSVEKLSSLVIALEAVVEKLAASNLEKDERLRKLELKIEELVSMK
ncbi:hypothetical protein HG536_0C05700 [Torulaspora globosa]|uniref:Coronin n=1 Tax=Torulaspora globosa TaxID=48254 RepID=A0A7G3ZFW5_9SACH|nr:uncharacterized protein HG536_0C05700 [Torulaspora globosa]QLL32401.1 hypothetical protein HG536_0C05700 [Torulaspora globosa]